MLKENTIHLGDCLDLMPSIPSKSVDMILCDLPYGNTSCSWDSIIPLNRLWAEYERVIKDNGAIVLTANSVFTFALYNSNPKIFRYRWIWYKRGTAGYQMSSFKPFATFEDVLIFYKAKPTYNPQMRKGEPYKRAVPKGEVRIININNRATSSEGERYPEDVIKIDSVNVGAFGKSEHPTQKPVALFEYLIKTYTNEGELVLDNCSGSGTTAIACMNSNRRFICIERDENYHRKSIERIANHEPLFHLPT
jgi:site-specific DNA-methyltransferase (adenine-specific)